MQVAVLIGNIEAITINMTKSAYLFAHSQSMVYFTFVITFDFVDLYGQPGPFGWNATVDAFKLGSVAMPIHRDGHNNER